MALGSSPTGGRVRPEAIRPDGAPPTIRAYDDDEAEARAIADACWSAHAAGVPWPRMAVLFRTNAQSARFETAFTRRGVPFRVGEGQRFAARPPVRALLDQLREVEREMPGRPFAHVLADLAAGAEAQAEAEGTDAVDEPAPNKERDRDDARAHRDALLELGRDYLESVGVGGAGAGAGSVNEFATWLDTATAGGASDAPGVDLVTFHRAKGLEWTVVFVTGLERGLVPISWSTTAPALAEERRLLHVALSRAEDELHCSWARSRSSGSRRAPREPSPWLGELEHSANHAPHGLLEVRRAPRDHLAELRETLAGASPAAPPPERARRLRR